MSVFIKCMHFAYEYDAIITFTTHQPSFNTGGTGSKKEEHSAEYSMF